MVLDVADDKISVLIYTGAITHPDLSHWVTFIQKLCCDCSYGKSHTHYFTGSLICQFEQLLISHAFLLCLSVLHHQEGVFLGSPWSHVTIDITSSPFLILTRKKQLKNKGLFLVLLFTQYTLHVGMKKSL